MPGSIVIANAMLELIKPLFPVVISHLEGHMQGMTLSGDEITIMQTKQILLGITGSRRKELTEKARGLGLILAE